MTTTPLLTDKPVYGELQRIAQTLSQASIEQLFAKQPDRPVAFLASGAGLELDYSKHLLTTEALECLIQLAHQCELTEHIQALFNGEPLNNTEARPALHSLLRASSGAGQQERYAMVTNTRNRMRYWADRINNAQQIGFSGRAITDVVNLGIGGSDLGPQLVTEALAPYNGSIKCHYVANVDPASLQNTLLALEPDTTLFIVCSKSFRTQETLTNCLAARDWLLAGGASTPDLTQHMLAVTTNIEAAAEIGIPSDNCLPLWDWVGGRYSVWSAIGLSCAVAVGWNHFEELLTGAEAMDKHFSSAPLAENLPVLMSLLEVWYCNFLGAGNHVVLPYDHSLRRLPSFLQQLTMESNGKSVTRDGAATDYSTGPVLWGGAGTMGQHSFHQLLHQGTLLCPVDFILPLTTHTKMKAQHAMLVANCLAQSRSLMVGRSLEQALDTLLTRGLDEAEASALAPHLTMAGNRPNSVITMKAVTPAALGALLALYEHRTFCSATIWGINPFDQWGVELGKEIGTQIDKLLADPSATSTMDAATDRLIAQWRSHQ